MSKTIVASIDLTKIDKSKIKQHENGAKYYTIVISERKEPDRFGNTHSVANGKEKGSNEPTVYIGSGKEYSFNSDNQAGNQSNDDDLPF